MGGTTKDIDENSSKDKSTIDIDKRNTGRNMCRMSFIVDQKNSNKIEKVSQRQMISQSQLIRNLIEEGLRGWDC